MDLWHTILGTAVMGLGAMQLALPKGTAFHKLVGRSYLVVMALTALSSFFVMKMTGGFNFLHILSVWVLITLGQTVWHLRRGNVVGHALSMVWLYGGTLTAGFLAIDRNLLGLPIPVVVGILMLVWVGVTWLSLRIRSRYAIA